MKKIDGGFAIGITGGIACGKSEVGRILEGEDIPVLDADMVAHEAMAPDGPCWTRLIKCFGRGILDASGRIDRSRLGPRVFADAEEREKLNAIVHPEVMARCRAWMSEHRGRDEVAAVMIPLLFEVGAGEGWDAIVCVSAAEELVLDRLVRKGLDREEARRRVAAQMPLEQKERLADYVLHNDGTLEDLEHNTRNCLMEMLKKEA